MLPLLALLVLAACITLVLAAMGKCPLWVPVGCLCVVALLQVWPR